MEFWDEKARPALLVAVKAACEAIREDMVAGECPRRGVPDKPTSEDMRVNVAA